MNSIILTENGINLVIKINKEGDISFLHLSDMPYDDSIIEERKHKWYRLFEIQESGGNQDDHHSNKKTGTSPGKSLRYTEHNLYRNEYGLKLEITAKDELNLFATAHLQFYYNIMAVRSYTTLENKGTPPRSIEYVSSFNMVGIDKEGTADWTKKMRIGIAHNTWQCECQWKEYSPSDLGLFNPYSFSLKRIKADGVGTWPCAEYLPIGYFTNTETGHTCFWQIETAGSWVWEISTMAKHLYIALSGACLSDNGWCKTLNQGDTFESDKCALSFAKGNLETANREMTKYRRRIRRDNSDNENMAVIFNDFMNCLVGDSTTEKLLPLIDSAAEAGCEYFCIDAGWYDDGPWWDGVGEWLPSAERYPGGIEEPIKYIHDNGMVPGLWLELEVMGINCPLADKVPDEWFFMRNGKRVVDHSRYQLDYRNPEVIAHANAVVKRIVEEYGVGYIKMDYNINAGVGTETNASSFGDGLRQHTDAYLAWIDNMFEKYPDLIIENCGSGGQRMTYAFLDKQSIQSVTDQESYLKMASIAAACSTACTPEQAAIWSYPLKDGDSEEVIFNMINAMLLRVHQSGHLAEISKERFNLVAEGIKVYKSIRDDIKTGFGIYPLGMPTLDSDQVAFGIETEDGTKSYLAVWRIDGSDEIVVPMNKKIESVSCIYPNCNTNKFEVNNEIISINMPSINSARLFEIKYEN